MSANERPRKVGQDSRGVPGKSGYNSESTPGALRSKEDDATGLAAKNDDEEQAKPSSDQDIARGLLEMDRGVKKLFKPKKSSSQPGAFPISETKDGSSNNSDKPVASLDTGEPGQNARQQLSDVGINPNGEKKSKEAYTAAAATPRKPSKVASEASDMPKYVAGDTFAGRAPNERMMSTSFAGLPSSPAVSQRNIRPNSAREPREMSHTPGAVAVVGIDGPTGDDDDDDLNYGDEGTAVASTQEHLVEAQPVSGDDEVQQEQEQIESNEHSGGNIEDDRVVAAKPVPRDQLESSGPLAFICRHKLLSFVSCVVIIGVVVSSLLASRNAANDDPQGTGVSVKVSKRFQQAMQFVTSTTTPEEILLNPTSPQHKALTWLADHDGAQLDFSTNSPRIVQRFALAVLYYSTQGYGWSNDFNFLSILNECEWTGSLIGERGGVSSCTVDGYVTSLILGKFGALTRSLRMLGMFVIGTNEEFFFALAENGLNGTLPKEIGSLGSLEILVLTNNPYLYGAIPTSLAGLNNLKDLKASGCFLASIPDDIGLLTSMSQLDVGNNVLSGTLPMSIGQMTLLDSLNLSNNRFTGQIPSTIGLLVNLRVLHAQGNHLTGSIPEELSNMVALKHADFSYNLLSDGAANLCGVNFIRYLTDCWYQRFPAIPKEIDCPCCSLCCSHQIPRCLANPDNSGFRE